MEIRVRKLTARCTEEIEDLYVESCPLTIGRSFIEGDHEDLLQAAEELRAKEVWFDHSTDNQALQRQSIKVAEAARQRWATKIETTVKRELLKAKREVELMTLFIPETQAEKGCPALDSALNRLF